MLDTIFKAVKSDTGLTKLLNEAMECAQVYVLARQTYIGYEGMGELVTMKEEFRDCMDKVIQYCKEKKYISEDISYDTDSVADGIVKGQAL